MNISVILGIFKDVFAEFSVFEEGTKSSNHNGRN